MSKTVLVTGGTGFVGGWTIVELLRQGWTVRATVRDLGKETALRQAIATEVEAGERLSVVAADLGSDEGWTAAMAGCAYVLHIASPLGGPGDREDQLIPTAVEGTLRVLRAAAAAKVERVVVTSSTAACTPAKPLARAIDEGDWGDPDQPGLSTYRKSKILAEKAVWDFAATAPFETVTILPGAIFGPVLAKNQQGSVGLIRGLLHGQPPALPRLAFNISDVRDLAALHVKALSAAEAAGRRFIGMGDPLWYGDVARILRKNLGEGAAKVPTRAMPDFVARLASLVSPQMRSLLPLLGRTQAFSTRAARDVLGFAPRPPEETVIDCGRSLIRA